MTKKQPSKWLHMPIREVYSQRSRFQPAPGVSTEELPLLEKQAIIDEIFRGMPIREVEYYEKDSPAGEVFMVTKGWPQLCAIFDFLDNKFPTWSDEDREKWQQSHK